MERQPCFVFCVVVVVVVVVAAAAAAHPHMPLSTTQSQNVLRSSCEVPDIFVDIHKIPILSTNIAKSSNIKVHEYSTSASQADTCGMTERQT